jgi:hypothetical protein
MDMENKETTMNTHKEPLRAEELDVRGEIFGIKFTTYSVPPGIAHTGIELYIEDDGYWHYITTTSSHWLTDLVNVSTEALAKWKENYNLRTHYHNPEDVWNIKPNGRFGLTCNQSLRASLLDPIEILFENKSKYIAVEWKNLPDDIKNELDIIIQNRFVYVQPDDLKKMLPDK